MSIITYLTTIDFEEGALARLGETLDHLGVFRPLVVTDEGLVAAGLTARLGEAAAALTDAPVFSGTPTNPTEVAMEAALEMYRTGHCDGIVAMGGGSPIDLAKSVALLATHEGPLSTYAAVLGGVPRITDKVAPVIAVPTTAGTGSEVGRAALITLKDGRKLGFVSPYLIPRQALCDPELTYGLPAELTAATGMDAIAHCIETYLSPRWNPPAEAIALDGLARAVNWLPRAVSDGGDKEARREMLMAALQGGLTFQKGLGAVHALSHPFGGLSKTPLHHGTLNSILLPGVLRFNEQGSETKYARIRHALGLAENADLAAYFMAFARRIGMPEKLGEIGADAALLPRVARAARLDHCHATNPRNASEADYRAMLEEAY